MYSEQLILHSSYNPHFVLNEFEEAYHHSKRQYSINHLIFSGDISTDNLIEAIEKARNICRLAGNNYLQHFKKVYIYEAENETIRIDYQMTKPAFNLIIMQLNQLNENRAKWIWKLAEI